MFNHFFTAPFYFEMRALSSICETVSSRAEPGEIPKIDARWLLPADWYLLPIVSYASSTEILRLRLRTTVWAGRSWAEP